MDTNYNQTPQDYTDGAGTDTAGFEAEGRQEAQSREAVDLLLARENTQYYDDGSGECHDFEIPEGAQINPWIMDEFKGFVQDNGLTQEQAQKLIDMQLKTSQAALESYSQTRKGWVSEIKMDPHYGGANLEHTLADARRALEHYDCGSDVKRLLEESGYGDNPHIIRFLASVARKHVSEDKVLAGRGSSAKHEKSLAERLWPD